VLTAVTSVSEVIAIFLQLILFANTAAFFYSLLGLVSHISVGHGDAGDAVAYTMMKNWPLFGQKFLKFR